MAAAARQCKHGQRQRRLTAGRGESPDPALECRHALLEHGDGRVRDPRIDVSGALEVEQARRPVDVGKDVGGRLVDRRGARAGRRIGLLAGVQAEGIELEQLRIDHWPAPAKWRGTISQRPACLNRPDAETFAVPTRSEEHTSELPSLMRISYAVFCLKKKNTTYHPIRTYRS